MYCLLSCVAIVNMNIVCLVGGLALLDPLLKKVVTRKCAL